MADTEIIRNKLIKIKNQSDKVSDMIKIFDNNVNNKSDVVYHELFETFELGHLPVYVDMMKLYEELAEFKFMFETAEKSCFKDWEYVTLESKIKELKKEKT